MVTQPTWQDLAIEQSNNPNNPHAYVPPASNPVSNNLANMADAEPGALPSPTAMGIGAPTSGRGSGVSSVPDQQPEFINKIIPGPPAGYKGGRNITEHTEQVPNPLYVKPVAPGAAQAASHQAAQATTPPAEQVSAPPEEQVSAPVVKVPSKQQSMASVVPGATPVKADPRLTETDDEHKTMQGLIDKDKAREERIKTSNDAEFGWDDVKGYKPGTSIPDSFTHHAGWREQAADERAALEKKEADRLITNQQDDQFALKTANDRDAASQKKAELIRAMKIDPTHWYKEKGTAGSILAAISIGLGAFGAAMPHTANHENYALDIITKAIDRDVDAQKEDIANKRDDVKTEMSQNDKKYVREHGIIADQRAAQKEGYYNARAMLVDNLSNLETGSTAYVNGQQLLSGIDDKIAKLGIDDKRHALQVALQIRSEQQSAALKNTVSPKEINERAAKIYDNEKLQPPTGMDRTEWAAKEAREQLTHERGVGYGGKGADPATVKSTAESAGKLASFDSAISDIQGLIDTRDKNGGGTLSAPNTATMGGRALGVRMSLDHALAGRVSDTTLGALKQLIPEDPNGYSPLGTTDAQLKQALKYVKDQRDNFANEMKGSSGDGPGQIPGATLRK
jgi:hypothetical protein